MTTPDREMSAEARLLADGREWLHRAIRLITETSKVKVWVPLVCSMVLTGYYVYTLHHRTAAANDHPQAVAESPAPVPAAEAAQPDHAVPADTPAAPVTGAGSDESYPEIRKRAEEAHAAQQFDQEAKLWQQFIEGAPAPQQACPQIGRAYELAGQIDDSVQAFEKCVALDPQNVDTLTAFAHVLQTKRDFTRAAELYRQVLSKDPKNVDAQTGVALLALKQDHLQEAQSEVDKILHAAPQNTDALLVAGIVAWRQGRLPDAERMFLRGENLDDSRADFHAFLGRIAEAEHRPQDAVRQYERALALDPNDSEIASRRDRLEQTAQLGRPEGNQ